MSPNHANPFFGGLVKSGKAVLIIAIITTDEMFCERLFNILLV